MRACGKWLIIVGIVSAVVIVTLGWWLRGYSMADMANKANKADTIFVVDTIKITQPIVVRSEELGIRSYKVKLLGKIEFNEELGIRNEELEVDSVEVVLPIEQKVYADSTYKAWVSGFDARLDSIQVYQPTRYITITTEKEPSRWSFGLQGGVGITPKGVQPYIGVGATYKFRIR